RDQTVLLHSADALAQIGTPAVADLIEACKDKNRDFRMNALFVLGQMRGGAAAAVPVLTAALKDRDGNVCSLAALALGQIGAEARAALPQLTACVDDADPNVRLAAGLARTKIRPADREFQARLEQEIARAPYGRPSPAALAQLDPRRLA